MRDKNKTKVQLISELAELRQRMAELEASEIKRKRAEEALRESEMRLRALVGSIALSALTGIYVLVFGSDGDVEGRVLFTALSISVLSILVMACGAALERRRLRLLPHVGTASAVAGFVLFMVVIWELGSHRVWVQCALSLVLASAAVALACLLSLAALAPRFRWVRALGFLSDAALTTMLKLTRGL